MPEAPVLLFLLPHHQLKVILTSNFVLIFLPYLLLLLVVRVMILLFLLTFVLFSSIFYCVDVESLQVSLFLLRPGVNEQISVSSLRGDRSGPGD